MLAWENPTPVENTSPHDDLWIVVFGLPLRVQVPDVLQRLLDWGLSVRDATCVTLSTSQRKFRMHKKPPVVTCSATIRVANTNIAWGILAGYYQIHWFSQPDTHANFLLGFRLEGTAHTRYHEAVLRVVLPNSRGSLAFLSILHAVGFQEEEAAQLIVEFLRAQGYSALWVRFDDCPPKQATPDGEARPQPCPWHHIEGGLTVFFPCNSAVTEALDRQARVGPPRLDLSFLVDIAGGQPINDLLASQVPNWLPKFLHEPALVFRFRQPGRPPIVGQRRPYNRRVSPRFASGLELQCFNTQS